MLLTMDSTVRQLPSKWPIRYSIGAVLPSRPIAPAK